MTDEELDARLESIDAEQAAAAMSPNERGAMLVELWRAAFQGRHAPNEETISVFENWWLPEDDGGQKKFETEMRKRLAHLVGQPYSPETRHAAERICGELFERWSRTQELGK